MNADTNLITSSTSESVSRVPMSFETSFQGALEMLHILGMGKWESTAPTPGRFGSKGGVWMENSQQARLQFLLQGVGVHDPDAAYSVLEQRTHYSRTDTSSITKARPAQSLTLNDSWYLDTCLSLPQKLEVVDALKHLGYSRDFIETAKRFVAGEPLAGSGPEIDLQPD